MTKELFVFVYVSFTFWFSKCETASLLSSSRANSSANKMITDGHEKKTEGLAQSPLKSLLARWAVFTVARETDCKRCKRAAFNYSVFNTSSALS